ncbi:MAG: MCE family protein [candidate division Zixibacteria bacterium]|nr:MCE family protein [candidate division Zixibacteria bacterium]
MAVKDNVEFRVGIIILLAIILVGVSLYWLQGYKLERNAQRILVRYDDVGTLSVGDKVTVSGVHKGKVNRLELTGEGVLVELLLYQDVVLKQDARFVIKNMGVMGERFIAISPGQDSLLFDNSLIIDGHNDTGIPEVIGLMGEMISEMRNLVFSVKNSIASDSALDKINRTLSNLEDVTSSVASYLERNEAKLDKTADNFLATSKNLSALISKNKDVVDSSLQRFDRVTVNLDKFVMQLDTLSATARRFAEAIDTQDGTLQLLLEDRRLYDDLRRTTDNLDDLINDIRANPRKYINLKVEIF